MKKIIEKNTILKASVITFVSTFSLMANAADGLESGGWGSPVATYSNINLGSGTEGVELSVNYGGYLSGVYLHRLELATRQDSEYYEVNYLLLNSGTDSGLTIETTWSEDVEFKQEDSLPDAEFEDVNSARIGLFAKLALPDERFNVYPRMKVGYMTAEDIEDTNFVEFEVAFQFNLNDQVWFGIAPVYMHSSNGVEIDEFQGTIDAGIKLSETFGASASVNHEQEVVGRVIFAF